MSLPVIATVGLSTLCVYRFLRGLWDVNFTPGPRPMLSPLSPFGAIFPANSLIPSNIWTWTFRQTAYFRQTHDVIAFVPWLSGSSTYYTNSLEVMKQLLGAENKIHLEKPQDLTLARLWGHSVASANGDVWRCHRRVVSPAFNNKTFSDVWRTVRTVYQDVVEMEGWDNENEVMFDEVNSFALKFTLIIISRCGFGIPIRWTGKNQSSGDFQEALRLVSATLIPRIILPKWTYSLPLKSLQRMDEAWTTVASFVLESIEKRKVDNVDHSADENYPKDMLTCLVTSWVNVDKHGLEERDVISNMFSLMFAGHETTSSGLVTTLVYLALFPHEQQKAFEEICTAFSESDPSELIEPDKLTFTLYCFWEGQRLYPSANFIPRQLTEDAIINVARPRHGTMHLKKGSLMMFDLIGIFRNPHIFDDPEVYRPGRWADIPEHDVATFGFGPRACIGKKFAQTEALAFLSTLLYDWKVEPNMLPGENRVSYEERVMWDAGLVGTAFGLKRVPLKLTKRRR